MKNFLSSAVILGMAFSAVSCQSNTNEQTSTANAELNVSKKQTSSDTSTTKVVISKDESTENPVIATNHEAIAEVMSNLSSFDNTPYKLGGTDHEGVDPSGLVYSLYQQAGIDLPRVTSKQAEFGTEIALPEIAIGDLVFFSFSEGKSPESVGIITDIDKTKILFTYASSSKGVTNGNLTSDYWSTKLIKITRPAQSIQEDVVTAMGTLKPAQQLGYVAAVRAALKEITKYEGAPYKYGGNSQEGIDASGLVCQAYLAAGHDLPRITSKLAGYGEEVLRDNILPGDLVFFSFSGNTTPETVGIVTSKDGGDLQFVYASSSKGVISANLSLKFWQERLVKVMRPVAL
ncbi:C40 family peptidase [Algivirga pacifica]|uniref:NlpC/P60 domain-containing protein n=1 Tax=Algivirga pacifica TaxID=1162670 RepID=A0ABP9DMZ4_9BACT